MSTMSILLIEIYLQLPVDIVLASVDIMTEKVDIYIQRS